LKVIVLSAVVALILGYAAFFVLTREQKPAYEAFVGSGARVGDQRGTNLVGEKWDGNPRVDRPAS
jgi:hypothetical protein